MLTFRGAPIRHCDGLSRRRFLRAGALGVGGLSLPGLLRAESRAPGSATGRSVIHIHLDGGPPQMDMIDPKPDAPAEYRGGFGTIPTAIPGVHFSDRLPALAGIADRLVVIRGLVGADNQHNAFQCQSGFDAKSLEGIGGRPALGSVVSALLGSADDPAPAFVDLMQGRPLVRNSARPGFLGPAHGPFRPDLSDLFERELEPGMQGELARLGRDHATSLNLVEGLSEGRLASRLGLLGEFDRVRRRIDASGSMEALDRFHRQAYGILTSGTLARAFDLESEDPATLARYTPADPGGARFYTSEGPEAARKLLLARRLVEAGARCVSVSISDFDTHKDNHGRMRYLLPIVDHALHALISDLEERGMLESTTVLAWGEFGRTPRVNRDGGRDHWPRVAMALMAGGGLPGGVVLGETDRLAGEAVAGAVHYQDVIATLYHQLGIDPQGTTLTDPTGRPQHLVTHGRPIPELV